MVATALAPTAPAPSVDTEEYGAARLWIYSAVTWLMVGTTFGLIAAAEMVNPDLFGGISFLSFGRIRPSHVNTVTIFWLSMANIGCFMYIIPKLMARRLWSEVLGKATAMLWNFAGIIGILTLLAGLSQAREYAELIWPVDILIAVDLVAVSVNILMTVAQRRERKLYVSSWYIIGSVVWFPIVYSIGNVIWSPFVGGGFDGALQGINDASWNWFYGHNILGLWFTTGGVGIVYYLVPVITRTPAYSHVLSMIGFWSIGLFYSMVGQHHILSTPTPGYLKTIATIASIALFIPVFTFITNILMTMRGNYGRIYASLPLKFALTGVVFYFVTCIQGPFQALQSFNRLIHFTNWIVGHAHLALLGTMTLWAMGGIYYIIPVTLKRRIYSPALAETQYWLVVFGFLLIMLSLQIVGLIQGASWLNGESVYKTVPTLKPFFIMRAVGGSMVVLGAYVQAYNIFRTVRGGARMDSTASPVSPSDLAA